ncbi:BCD family MFS transporter [Thalassobaculum sp. OXR-137]|uniref:BCD family MFS transporter n=1 Tax=Thalassobaculum sp. OXR-137 TaxID=3100173 RepID=UPI002AC8EEF8|nr:BCD family MFS transporter [Thalassobaculum sp. OXR-137]WPZ36834.1 BCD family MFS transporter [Thalassobaculum sp. OXR-137]
MVPVPGPTLGWLGILRLGLVQTALGAVVVISTSTLNRVMVVELALPAMVPGLLVAAHYAVQVLRPRWGYGSDAGGRRTPWIVGGMALLSLGGAGAAAATAWMSVDPVLGLVAAAVAFLMIGIGVGAAGTSLLVLLATEVAPERRPAAATVVWLMMIAGFAVTAGTLGAVIDPYSPQRLVAIVAVATAIAFAVATLAVWGVERGRRQTPSAEAPPPFRAALAEAWRDATVRRFSVFVFLSMLAYSAQDLILEPYAGLVFGFTPGQSTALSGVHHGGVLLGMIAVGAVCTFLGRRRIGTLGAWVVGGCLCSGVAMLGLALAGTAPTVWPLRLNVFVLGVSNGAFAVAAIAMMMSIAAGGQSRREGTRMGVFGAAQAVAFGLGGFLGAVSVDLARLALDSIPAAYGTVFAVEAGLFVLSGLLALRLGRGGEAPARTIDRLTLGRGVIAGVVR